MRGFGVQRRSPQPAVREIHAGQQVQRLAHRRRRFRNQRVPEEQLQQQRDVAQRLHVDQRHAADQPVPRQPREADDQADDARRRDADQRHAQRVQQPDEKGAGVAVRRVVGDRAFADPHARFAVEKAEARGDVESFQIFDGVDREPGDRRRHERDRENLEEDVARADRGQRAPPADHRAGAAYINPPSVWSAFSPRSRPRGEPAPTLRSKISP